MTEPNQIQCPHCGQPYSMSFEQAAQYAGQQITCQRCQKTFVMPSQPALGASPVAPPPPGSYSPVAPVDYYTAPGQQTRTSGMAIASLICGLLTCFVPILSSILAVIFGILGLKATNDPRVKGRGLAISGLVLGGLGVVVIPLMISILLPALNTARERANRVNCGANLRMIGQGLMLYGNDNRGQCPPNLGMLITDVDLTSDAFCCPSSNDTPAPGSTPQAQAANLTSGEHLSYIYIMPKRGLVSAVGDIVVYEPLANHNGEGINALFGDGHVEWIPKPQAQQVISGLERGQQPGPM